jgi:hypothetical protein
MATAVLERPRTLTKRELYIQNMLDETLNPVVFSGEFDDFMDFLRTSAPAYV